MDGSHSRMPSHNTWHGVGTPVAIIAMTDITIAIYNLMFAYRINKATFNG